MHVDIGDTERYRHNIKNINLAGFFSIAFPLQKMFITYYFLERCVI